MNHNYYSDIKELIIEDELYSRVKDYSKERHRVSTYYKIGKILNEAGGKYGDKIIEEYSKKLVLEFGKKYNRRTLYRMKQFYAVFSNEIVSPLVTQSSWSHCLLLLSLKDYNAIYYYMEQTIKRNLSKRQLQEIMKNQEYERLLSDTKIKLVKKEETNVIDYVKNPIMIKNNIKYNLFSEKVLKDLIIENLSLFLKELGEGFSYIDNEYKIKLGNQNNYIDLLLYNIKYRCYVVIELKVTGLKKEHIGQIEVYMNYINDNIKSKDDNDTVGIIICKEENQYIIRYRSNPNIVARTYLLI